MTGYYQCAASQHHCLRVKLAMKIFIEPNAPEAFVVLGWGYAAFLAKYFIEIPAFSTSHRARDACILFAGVVRNTTSAMIVSEQDTVNGARLKSFLSQELVADLFKWRL